MNYIQVLHGTTKAFGWANIGCQSTHLPFKTRCKLLASTDNWKASKATVLDSTVCMPINAVGGWLKLLALSILSYHHDISWQGQGQETIRNYDTVIHPKEICWCPIFWKETGRLEGSGRNGHWIVGCNCLCGFMAFDVYFPFRQVSTFIITAASKILRDLMDLLLNFCHHLRLALSPTFEIGVPVYHHTWKQYLLDISKGAKMGHVWKGPHDPSVTIFLCSMDLICEPIVSPLSCFLSFKFIYPHIQSYNDNTF